MARIRAPVRCFLNEIPAFIAREGEGKEEKLQFRLIGTIVSLETKGVHTNTSITLDDGTALADVQSLPQKATDILAHLGMTVECIVDVRKETSDLIVQTLFSLHDDEGAAPLRWLELTHRKQQQGDDYDDNWLGYPQQRTGPDDLLMVITGVCRPDEDTSRPDAGASLDELAACFGLDAKEALSMIHELQGDALIYQNEHGRYVPL